MNSQMVYFEVHKLQNDSLVEKERCSVHVSVSVFVCYVSISVKKNNNMK